MCGAPVLALIFPKLSTVYICYTLFVMFCPHNKHPGASCNIKFLGGWNRRDNGNISYIKWIAASSDSDYVCLREKDEPKTNQVYVHDIGTHLLHILLNFSASFTQFKWLVDHNDKIMTLSASKSKTTFDNLHTVINWAFGYPHYW